MSVLENSSGNEEHAHREMLSDAGREFPLCPV